MELNVVTLIFTKIESKNFSYLKFKNLKNEKKTIKKVNKF